MFIILTGIKHHLTDTTGLLIDVEHEYVMLSTSTLESLRVTTAMYPSTWMSDLP